ncbi:cytochrome c biogenesis CcdA family protein [Clostridium ganghwense]|uniref:Cytochrome c biogenesis CcdA family protein n=1 Tax=Clostridium ganghwense TaxID=312089 RepID=A0ABT4CQ19_9CLOT|nr:cytochrome c biogenesis CcdA family protein [Clostridium ganghwense]MCY6370186.1 cytochrome c biogenesis CcdA family protein [Clostridium ganghwense]
MSELLNNFSNLISNNVYIALGISFLAGIVSSFSPCILSTLPLVIGYVGESGAKDKKTAFKYSLFFSIGLVITFTVLGVVFSLLGQFMNITGTWWYLVLGVIMLLVGLHLLGVIGSSDKACKMPNRRKGFWGAFFLGILGGALSSPCSTPVLAAILAFVAQKGNVILGGLMLLLYSIGHSILILIAGTSIGFVQQLSMSNKTMAVGRILKTILGILVIIMGLYLVYLGV